ncbi:cation transporter [Weissella confusa]|uniref:cation transporter n=1 Tax=Weissella confusa TaxID=1583 RepID=UPI0018F25165|nr:cation transporter [Weissella confusa]MBJ7647486.1 cation transporter [Weissella confusa]MBJ7679979.1 cation transporter [Weissella confusa]
MEVRQKLLARGIQLEVISMAWMAIEFVLGVSAGIHAGSILLIAFGLDAFLETVAGGILIWRLRAEYNGADAKTVARVERTASRLVKEILLLLSGYVLITSIMNLINHEMPAESGVGLVIAIMSVILMPIMTTMKRRIGDRIQSEALRDDAMCNVTCAVLAGLVLGGMVLTALFGLWWADAVAAILFAIYVGREGLELFEK